jgi:hypothetical protein
VILGAISTASYGDRADDPELDDNFTNNQQQDPIAHSPQTNLKTSDEEQSDLNTFWRKEQSTDQTINRRYSR